MGGTFDPVHLGHLALADEAWKQLKMQKVIFIPAGHPYFKALTRISAADHRLNMLKLALAGKSYFELSLIEIERPGPSYALDTLTRMKAEIGPADELFFILGWDSLLTLPKWEQPERLISLCRLVSAPRPGFPHPDLSLLEKDLPGISQRTVIMNQPVIDISSTDIRERVRQGLPIDHLVPAAVVAYIKEKGLYKQ